MGERGAGDEGEGMESTAVKDGNENYILNGEKWFSSSASVADMALVMAKTDPNAPRHKQYSTFIVELPNPGYKIKRNIKNMAIEGPHADVLHGGHSEIEIRDLKVPADNLLGGEGNGFNMGQHRLAYGRLRHGMHNVAKAQRALDMAGAHVDKRPPLRALLAAPQAGRVMLGASPRPLHHRRRAARRPPGGAVYAGRMRQPALHRAADAAAHRLQGGKGHGPDPGKFDRESVPGPHGSQGDRHRDPAARRAWLQSGSAAGQVVHAGALAAAGRRPRRSAQVEGRPQRHQGFSRAGHHRVGLGRRFDLSVIASQRVGAKRRPMTGSAKQSMTTTKLDCFVAALLAMTEEISHSWPVFLVPPPASRCRGGRNLPAIGCDRPPRKRDAALPSRSCRTRRYPARARHWREWFRPSMSCRRGKTRPPPPSRRHPGPPL